MLATGTNRWAVAPASPSKSTCAWKEIVEPAELFLEMVSKRLDQQVEEFDPEIAGYARYALNNQGKQLRPALVALSGGAAGQVNDELVTVAVIIEMIHLATLVHDDVMDAAAIRRQLPTVSAHWGNEISVLLGDCLFAHALKLAAGFPTPEVCRAVACATNTVCAGEILEIQSRGKLPTSRSIYFKVLEMKTAELFGLSCELGAWLAGANPAKRRAVRKYGLSLGTAYQIFDDCLDLYGTESHAGKSLGTDLANGNFTLPILVVLEKGAPDEIQQIQEMVRSWDPEHLPKIKLLLEQYGALNEASAMVDQYLGAARQCLGVLAPSRSRSSLIGLTEFLTQQTRALGVTSGNCS